MRASVDVGEGTIEGLTRGDQAVQVQLTREATMTVMELSSGEAVPVLDDTVS